MCYSNRHLDATLIQMYAPVQTVVTVAIQWVRHGARRGASARLWWNGADGRRALDCEHATKRRMRPRAMQRQITSCWSSFWSSRWRTNRCRDRTRGPPVKGSLLRQRVRLYFSVWVAGKYRRVQPLLSTRIVSTVTASARSPLRLHEKSICPAKAPAADWAQIRCRTLRGKPRYHVRRMLPQDPSCKCNSRSHQHMSGWFWS